MADTDPRGHRLDPASAREEAERLVAAGLAAASIAADRIGNAGVMARDIAALLPEAIEQLRSDRSR